MSFLIRYPKSEELQLVLEPLYRSIVFGEDYDAPTVEEMVYTAVISFAMTGVVEGDEIAAYARNRPAQSVEWDFADAAIDPDGNVGYDNTWLEEQGIPEFSGKTTQHKPFDL